MRRVVVIGAGQAGLSCAAKLRAEGVDGEITLIGDEPLAPYQRPPLSKAYLLGDMPLERLFLRPEAFYAEQEIALRLGAPVTGIDPGAKQVALAGETLDYDDLVLATGARARPLPEDQGGALGGVFTIRDLADIDRLAPEMREGRRLLVIGGGYIGLEAAAVARIPTFISGCQRLPAMSPSISSTMDIARARSSRARSVSIIRPSASMRGCRCEPAHTLRIAARISSRSSIMSWKQSIICSEALLMRGSRI